MIYRIPISRAVEILEEQLSYCGYLSIKDYNLFDFLTDPNNKVYFLSGIFGFHLHKKYDSDGMYLEYTQYPKYETTQSFVWVLNRNNEWKNYRILDTESEVF